MKFLRPRRLADWQIRSKLAALVAVLLFFIAVTAGIGLYTMNQVSIQQSYIADRDLPASAALRRVAMMQLERDAAFERALRAASNMSHDMGAGVSYVKASTEFSRLGEQVADELATARDLIRDAALSAHDDAGRQAFFALLERINSVELDYLAYSVDSIEALEATGQGQTFEAIGLTQEASATQDRIDRELSVALVDIEGFTHQAIQDARNDEETALWWLLAVAILALLVGAALAYIVGRAITRPLSQAIRAVDALAAGDTDVRLAATGSNEVGVLSRAVEVFREELIERQRLQAHLLKSQRMDAIGQLTGGIAHDFNNLLMIVDGYTRRAAGRAVGDSEIEAALSEVLKATDSAAKLTRQLLAFSGRQAMENRTFNVAEALQDAEPLFRKSVSEGVELHFEYEDDSLGIRSDETEFTQAILNLVNNARDALPGVGLIGIRTKEVRLDASGVVDYEGLEPGDYVEITVSDTGSGIEDDVKPKIFEPFFTTKGQGKGAGLGLSMVLGFSQQSGGTVVLESQAGEGTTVRILLPLADGAAREAAAEIDEACTGRGERVLIVEDEDALRELNSGTLRELGYDILTACDGFEALEVEEECEGEIDLLLSDVVMPQMGGFELCQIMREKRPDLKTIFISGYPNRDSAEGTSIPDNCQFLQKPVKPAHLAQVIRQELDSVDS